MLIRLNTVGLQLLPLELILHVHLTRVGAPGAAASHWFLEPVTSLSQRVRRWPGMKALLCLFSKPFFQKCVKGQQNVKGEPESGSLKGDLCPQWLLLAWLVE